MKLGVVGVLSVVLALAGSGCSDSTTQDVEVSSLETTLLKQADQAETEQLAIGKAAQNSVFETIKSARQNLENVANAATKWDSSIAMLMTDDTGKRLAANPETLSRFRALYLSVDRPTTEVLASAQKTLEVLGEPIEKALNDPADPMNPSEDIRSEITKVKGQTDEYLAAYEKQQTMLNALIKSANSGSPGEKSLREALDEEEQKLALQDAANIEGMAKAAHEENVRKVAEAEQERHNAESDANAQKARDEALKIQDDTEKERLVALAHNADTQSRLAPFIQPGMTKLQMTSRDINFGAIRKQAPVSFKKITEFGGLDDSENGRKVLVEIANHKKNDRPGWPTPTTDEQWKTVEESQRLLRELGPTLVELGMLSE